VAKASIYPKIPFKGVRAYCDYWDVIVAEIMAGGGRFATAIREQEAGQEAKLRRGKTNRDNIIAYGEPVPDNVADAMYRRYFLNMELYNNAYTLMQPFLAKLEKMSNGIIPQDVIKPNDRELGVFSFERAMMSLQGATGLCVQKGDKKTFYKMNEGQPIIGKDGNQSKDKEGRLLFKIEKNGETAFLTQLEEGGDKRWVSSNKKSFLYKEKHPKPKRMIRLFVLIGQNWGVQAYWSGVTAVILANFLEGRGYAIRITAVVGVSSGGLNFGSGKEYGSRYNKIDVKGYEDTMDSLALLYVLADPSFFRIRQFKYYLAQQYKYKDDLNIGLGSMPDPENFRKSLDEQQKMKYVEDEKDILYYFIGGSDVEDESDVQRQLIRIVCEVENQNKEILAKLMGVHFTPTDPSANNTGDIDCSDKRTWGRP
jgi:hypothetical protein